VFNYDRNARRYSVNPAKAGVYIVRDPTLPEYTLYVGIASNLKSRLTSSHQALKYCRDRGIEYTIDYELEPNEKKRKKREHQLISELDAKLNDGEIPSESGNSRSVWQDDIDSLINQLQDERVGTNLDPYEQNMESWRQREFCISWFRTAWETLDDALEFLLCGRKLKGFMSENIVLSDLFNGRDPKRILINSLSCPGGYSIFWIDKEPAA